VLTLYLTFSWSLFQFLVKIGISRTYRTPTMVVNVKDLFLPHLTSREGEQVSLDALLF